MVRWEYHELFHVDRWKNAEEGLLDRLGSEGWELVTDSGGKDWAGVLIFKRPYKLCPNCGKRTPFAYASDGGFEPRVNKDCPHCWKWSWEDEARIYKRSYSAKNTGAA